MIEATTSFAAQERIAKDAFEFQMLYGIRRDLQTRLSRRAIRSACTCRSARNGFRISCDAWRASRERRFRVEKSRPRKVAGGHARPLRINARVASTSTSRHT
jgi:hypothetical protein